MAKTMQFCLKLNLGNYKRQDREQDFEINKKLLFHGFKFRGQSVSYKGPFKLYFRRNESWIVKCDGSYIAVVNII